MAQRNVEKRPASTITVPTSATAPATTWAVVRVTVRALVSRFETRIICTLRLPSWLDYMHAKNLDAYLVQADGINALMPQARRLLELRQVFLEVLPKPLAGFATVANYRQGKIVVFATNAAIAAKLKLLSPALMDRFATRGLQVTALTIEVQPGNDAERARPKAAVLTDTARRALAELASQLTESELKTTIATMAENKVSKR